MTKIRPPNEQAVLDAALALAKVQALDIQEERSLQADVAHLRQCEQTWEAAKWALIVADAEYATANLAVATLHRELQDHVASYRDSMFVDCHMAKLRLWTVATDADEEIILQAAYGCAQKMEVSSNYVNKKNRLDQAYNDAKQALEKATRERTKAVQERGKAKAAYDAAYQAVTIGQRRPSSNLILDGLEHSLIEAAAALNSVRPFSYQVQITDCMAPGWYDHRSGMYTKLLPIEISDSRLAELLAAARDEAQQQTKDQSAAQKAPVPPEAAPDLQIGSSMMSE